MDAAEKRNSENRRPHRGIEAGQSVLLRVARPWRGALGRGAGTWSCSAGQGRLSS